MEGIGGDKKEGSIAELIRWFIELAVVCHKSSRVYNIHWSLRAYVRVSL